MEKSPSHHETKPASPDQEDHFNMIHMNGRKSLITLAARQLQARLDCTRAGLHETSWQAWNLVERYLIVLLLCPILYILII